MIRDRRALSPVVMAALVLGGCSEVVDGPSVGTDGSDGVGSTGGRGSIVVPRETDPARPDLLLFTAPACAVVPNGALSGADNLTLFVAVRNGGPGTVDGLVPVEISDGAGVRARLSSGISTGSAVSPLGVDLTPSDYGRTQRFVVTADPHNAFVEPDEDNNDVVITVRLPARPAAAQDVPCTVP